MKNFSFHSSTRIHFGEGQIAAIDQELPENARILLAYGGGSIKKNGVYDQVINALGDRYIVEFSGIQPNPTYDTLMQAVDLIHQHDIDGILAVGGGSVIDGAKFIAAAACYQDGDPWLMLSQRQAVTAALPIGCVLTLPATGSETNGGSVVTRDNNKLVFSNPLLKPLFAILDPSTTLSLSDRQISNGIVDAFVHTMEQYLTYPADAKVQDRFAEGLLLTLIEEGNNILLDKNNLTHRANIMWSACLALNGIIGVGVPQDWSTHMIAHELTGMFGIDHARTLSIILPANMKVRREEKREKLLQYAERVWGIRSGSDNYIIDSAIEQTEAFFKSLGMPVRMSDVDIPETAIDALLQKLKEHGMVALGEKGTVDLTVSKSILQQAS
jgi:NADP-dependent alcohol dehydrogenase